MYEMRTDIIELEGGERHELPSAYTSDGHYIGNEDWAKMFEERGIAPTVREGQTKVCSIGFCEREQKWYGWSHRAMHGFAVGDTVSPGDIAYTDERGTWTAQTLDDAKQMACDYAEGVG